LTLAGTTVKPIAIVPANNIGFVGFMTTTPLTQTRAPTAKSFALVATPQSAERGSK
jgi:hypothetical protein